MANLRANNVCGTDGRNAITGSVEFTGSSYLTTSNSIDDFNFGSGDFTIEFFINSTQTTRTDPIGWNYNYTSSGWAGMILNISSGSSSMAWYENANSRITVSSSGWNAGNWNHIAVTRYGNNLRMFLNGIQVGSTYTTSHSYGASNSGFIIGTLQQSPSSGYLNGFISNLRVIKGTALYTSDFIPPTRKLIRLPGTVLLCCQDNNSVTTEATGKTITANGNPAARRFVPQVGSDGGLVFDGVTKVNTQNYFYLPTGVTENREPAFPGASASSARGLFAGGFNGPSPAATNYNIIDYINIASTGDAQDFGDLTSARNYQSAFASSTRGIVTGGNPSSDNRLDYITIASTGNAQDFGDALYIGNSGSLANSTRGIFAGGESPVSPNPVVNNINYVTIASTGNVFDFGDLLVAVNIPNGSSSSTRGIFSGGSTGPASTNTIQYITIATTGNSVDFGDLTISIGKNSSNGGSCSSGTRALYPGGISGPARINSIDYITIASLGNAVRFGDLSSARDTSPCSSTIRGIFGGGGFPSQTNAIDYVTIASTGNTNDFGDLTTARSNIGSCSNGHGGLG